MVILMWEHQCDVYMHSKLNDHHTAFVAHSRTLLTYINPRHMLQNRQK